MEFPDDIFVQYRINDSLHKYEISHDSYTFMDQAKNNMPPAVQVEKHGGVDLDLPMAIRFLEMMGAA